MKSLLIILIVMLSAHVALAELSAHDIMVKNDEVRRINSLTSHAKLTSGGAGADRVKEFNWWKKLTSDGIHFNTLSRFLFPPEIKGEGVLFLEHDKDQTDVQLYLPAYKKVRRVESQQQSGSFMGSEFSYADIAAPHVDDFNYKLLKEETCGEAGKCFVIESTPATDAVKERTGASRGVSWVRKDNYMATSGEYYDLEGKLWKKMEATEISEVDPKSHKWMALHVKMTSTKTNRFTILQFDHVKVNEPIADSVFSLQNLAREK